MDKQQIFLSNNIFDIDSALDRLEENLFTSCEEKSEISTEPLNQQTKSEIKERQQQNKESSEENGNLTFSDDYTSEVPSVLDVKTDEKEEVNVEKDVIRSEILDNGISSTTSFSVDDKSSECISSSTNSEEDSSSAVGDGFQNNEISSQITTHLDNDDSRRLISDESSNQPDDVVDDQPVTTDLTLTKTVELTENEPDPIPEVKISVQQTESEQTCNIIQPEIVKPDEELKHIEEANDFKEMSINNFESTMDDISDAELESLEQELEDIVAVAEQNVEKVNNEKVVKELEESIEKTVEIEAFEVKSQASEVQVPKVVETPTKVEDLNQAEIDKPLEAVEVKPEASKTSEELYENPSEIPEESVMSEMIDEQKESSASEAQDALEPQESSVEPAESAAPVDADSVLSTSSTDESTSIQNLPSQSNEDFSINESNSTGSLTSAPDLGRVPPYWIPDDMTDQCMQCDAKFSLIKRRHHCRACGLLLCSSCSSQKFFLHYAGRDERVCLSCFETLSKAQQQQQNHPRNPNPANPMEYCSTLPPQQQVNASSIQPPTVMVPSGVLKRGPKSSERKSVIFSDGIRPGTDLDEPTSSSSPRATPEKPPKLNMPTMNEKTNSFIPEHSNDLPPVLTKESEFHYVDNSLQLLQRLRQEELKFAINKNFYVTVKIVTLICCTNKTVINFSTSGLLTVRQDELMILLELNDDMIRLPKEVFLHLNEIYGRADKQSIVIKEYGHSQASSNNFLGAFGGFLFIKPSFQCQQSLTLPEQPYLIGLLVHKWEIPWMRLFPLRLILRLGALYRYYPTPILSNVNREPVFAEIGNTVMNFLVDFRNFSYTIDIIKGLNIHMEERKTSVFIPKNRYDQIMKVINNSSDHLLAFGADFSKQADGHLVCIQNTDSGTSESLSYSTQAINIQGQNRIHTGASFLILNGALKASSGLKAKCSIVEDGLMIQISSTKMTNVRDALRNMKDVEISCGPIDEQQKEAEETVSIEWVADDVNFNLGVLSPIDNQKLEGKESIRMRVDFSGPNHTKMLRWSEVFLLESDDDIGHINDDHLNYSKVAESIAKASGSALLPFLDLMAVNQLKKIGIRVTLGENIKYLAGSGGVTLSPIYMNALDNELIGVIHRQASSMARPDAIMTLELIFYILNK
ncbi:CLUMA_CG001903, isoform A [Clunio marinus]|uniref:CLUMA_CG001903, isoform A n=1 Tax=Clunio marinus TaxID=568069 RepID=A0A1J1HNS2_9DIPT|nr:CLUMA_CG001903, isoform A [Clunio marinus]